MGEHRRAAGSAARYVRHTIHGHIGIDHRWVGLIVVWHSGAHALRAHGHGAHSSRSMIARGGSDGRHGRLVGMRVGGDDGSGGGIADGQRIRVFRRGGFRRRSGILGV